MENALWSEFWYDLERQFDPDSSPRARLQSGGESVASTPVAAISKSDPCTTSKATHIRTPTTFAEFAEACGQYCSSNEPKPLQNLENRKNEKAMVHEKKPTTFAESLQPRNQPKKRQSRTGVKREKTKRRIKMLRNADVTDQCPNEQGTTKKVANETKSRSPKQIKSKKLSRNQRTKKTCPDPKQNVKKTSNENQNNNRKSKRGRSKRKSASLQSKLVFDIFNVMLLP